MSSSDTAEVSHDIQHYTIKSFKFLNGSTHDITLAYKSLNPSASKAALVPTCYGGRIASTLTFTNTPSAAFADHHVIVVAMLGNGESSSPSTTGHSKDKFPDTLDYQDQINAQYMLATEKLGLKELDVVLGFSMGGQQAYYWAAMYPDFVKNSVCICGSARTSPHNHAFLEGPVTALMNSSDYADGQYVSKGTKPTRGLRAFARAYLAWLYSAAWYRERVFEKTTKAKSIAEFMDLSDGFMLEWDPEDVLILARQWQAGDISKIKGGSFEEALGSIKARVLVMPGETDQYFRVEDSEIEMKSLKRAEYAPIPSIWGHAAGGGMSPDDTVWMDKKVKEWLGKA